MSSDTNVPDATAQSSRSRRDAAADSTQQVTDLALAEQAWRETFAQWSATLQHIAPRAMAPQLQAAVTQAQLCMNLMFSANRFTDTDWATMMIADAPLASAIAATMKQAIAPPTAAERDYLVACEALFTRIAGIAQDTLAKAGEQLTREQSADGDAHSVQHSQDRCAALMEHSYAQHTGSDSFAQVIANWVHAHARTLTERRQTPLGDVPPMAANASTALSCAHLGEAGELVFEVDGVRLLRYRNSNKTVHRAPLLIVYSLFNRPRILDLQQQRSLLRTLCTTGRDVYLIDWGAAPTTNTAKVQPGLNDYIYRYLHECVRHVQQITDGAPVDLVGICQGGPFALCYAAMEHERVRRIALIASPADFHVEQFLLAKWSRAIDADALIDSLGDVPGYLLDCAFLALKPTGLSAFKALELLELRNDPLELATRAQTEGCLSNSPDQSGPAFAEFINTFVRDNAMINSTVRIGHGHGDDVSIDLAQLQHPVLNVYASRDRIVPAASCEALKPLLVNAQCVEHEIDCSHIDLFSRRETLATVSALLDEWFSRND